MNKLLRFSLVLLLAMVGNIVIANVLSSYVSASISQNSNVMSTKSLSEEENVNVTATYKHGQVVLSFEDYANGAVEPGNGTVEVWNEVQKVAELVDAAFGDQYHEVIYSLSTTLEPGTYTAKVPAGAVKGNKTSAFGKLTAIPACEANFVVTSTVESALGEPSMELLEGTGVSVKYTYPDSQEGMNSKGTKEVDAVLYEDGVQVAAAAFGFQFSPSMFYGAHFDYAIQEGKTYQVVFPAGAWYIYSVDDFTGAETTLEESAEQTYEWVAGAAVTPGDGEGGNTGDGWTFASCTPAQGTVESLSLITFAYPAGVNWTNEYPYVAMQCPSGATAQVMLADNFVGACNATVIDQTLTANGTYTLVIPAGTLTSDQGLPCAEMTYTWTIGEGGSGDETPGENPGDVTGSKWQEQIFAQNTPVAIPLNIETDGVKLTSVGREFMGTVIDVSYNMYEEGELDWKNGTQLVFTAKDNITGIVIDGQFKEFASATPGNYINGAWTGLVKAGETVTLTANDGINIHSIIVLYNGAELNVEDVDETDIDFDINITKTSWAHIGSANGETIGTVSSSSSVIDHYTVEATCEEDAGVYVTFVQIEGKDGKIVTYDPQNLWKGYHYTITVKAYDTPQYGALPIATKTYEFVGEGDAAVATVDIAASVTNLKEGVYGYVMPKDGQVEVTFGAPVKDAKAWVAQGMEGSTNVTMTQKDAEGKVWMADMTSFLSAEGSADLNVTAYDKESGLQIKGENSDHSFSFTISCNPEGGEIDIPELATLTIGTETYVLSETEAIELGVYPAGAVIAINNTDEAIKKVTYEIVDNTTNEILKSQGDLNKGEDGLWRAEMPKSYELAKGHSYSIHVKALNGMSSFTSLVLYEYNFLVNGTANVATYSSVKIVSVTPSTDEIITEATPTITLVFSDVIKSLTAKAILGQMDSRDIPSSAISSVDGITWTVKVPEGMISDGALSLTFVAVDAEGNRVTDPQDGVGTPENCYVQYGWASTIGLPTPALAENGKTMESIEKLTFTFDGIGLNQDQATATWKDIVIEKDGVALDMTIEESQFEVLGEDAGNALVWTLPETLYKGVYTIKVPAYALMLGHDLSNFYSGACEFTVTATAETPAVGPEVILAITKTDWSKIGNQNGEAIGTALLKGAEVFDHIEAEIRCKEDADQYISFANLLTNGGKLTCYAWEGGSYDLNKGYHYTLTVKAFDVPYYGVEPVAVATYEFVGTGIEAVVYSDIDIAKVDLEEEPILFNGYKIDKTSFDVTFSAPASNVSCWLAMGMDGSVSCSAKKKSEDGTVWTILLPEDILSYEGSVNLMVQAWDASGVLAKGWNADHAFDFNLSIGTSDPEEDAIKAIEMAYAGKPVYTLSGVRIKASQMKKGQVYIINGVKVLKK